MPNFEQIGFLLVGMCCGVFCTAIVFSTCIDTNEEELRYLRDRNMECESDLMLCEDMDCSIVAEQCCTECYESLVKIGKAMSKLRGTANGTR